MRLTRIEKKGKMFVQGTCERLFLLELKMNYFLEYIKVILVTKPSKNSGFIVIDVWPHPSLYLLSLSEF